LGFFFFWEPWLWTLRTALITGKHGDGYCETEQEVCMWLCHGVLFLIYFIIINLFYFTHTYCRWHSGHHQAVGINRTEPNWTDPTHPYKEEEEEGALSLSYCALLLDGSPTETDKRILQNLGTTQPHDGIWTLPNNQHNPPNESSNENVVELMLLPLNTTPPMKVQTKMSSNLCCCLGEEATLCVPNSSSDIDGWVPPKHELWKAGGRRMGVVERGDF